MKRGSVSLLACFLLAAPLIFAGCGSDSNSKLPTVSKAATDFVGPERCAACHDSAHTEWKDSWHTKKTTYGPNWSAEKFVAGKAKFLPGVIDMWDNGDVKSHMILDRAPLTDADKTAGITNKNFVTKKKYDWKEVDIIVGETRKQRYAVYYDGGPVAEALYSISKDGGINYQVQYDTTVEFTGNKERAGYKFLTVEMNALKNPVEQKTAEYGEFRSWQERCIGCHTTGFDVAAWDKAKADFIAGARADLKDIFIADIRISCEACHGAGGKHAESRDKADIINPAKLSGEQRKMVCEQCHTRAAKNLVDAKGFANDNRGFVLGEHGYMDIMEYQRPAWGGGSRAVSMDGKGRRDHQQDMDIRLTDYINKELGRGTAHNPHGDMACFDCHNSHGVGNVPAYSVAKVDKKPFTVNGDADGTVRLTQTREQLCGSCHTGQVNEYRAVLNGQTGFGTADGFKATGYPRVEPARGWDTPYGRGDNKQHIFATDNEGRSFGLNPEEYIWAYNGQGVVKANYKAIWPWERALYTSKGDTIVYGPAPWNGETTTGEKAPVEKTAFATQYAGPGACVVCHKDVHGEWKDSWHTKKTTYGPNWSAEKFAAGKAKFLPGVIDMWDNGDVNSHMILDRYDSNTNYVTVKKYDWTEVDIIVGETRKQRYAVYYDGKGPVDAYLSRTVDGGIKWTVDTSAVVVYPGNLDRAGYKFLTVEMDALKNPVTQKSAMYGEWRSWQERCIGCHTTGFDVAAWNTAKADYIDGKRADLKDIFIADIRISCESCHGPGADHAVSRNPADIINPAKLSKNDPTRQLVCGQCHTRAQSNLLHAGANDNRGFVLGETPYTDVMEYTRPAWGDGNRQVSIDGKGRRDHQQDMDIMLTDYIRGGNSVHGSLACFDCHNSHKVGNVTGYATATLDKSLFTTGKDADGLVRLSAPRQDMCGTCHSGSVGRVLGILNGQTGFGTADGFKATGYPRVEPARGWDTPYGRGDRKQHIFNSQQYFDFVTGTTKFRSYGLAPEQYVWSTANTDPTTKDDYRAIWPWERALEESKGKTIVYGATPWVP